MLSQAVAENIAITAYRPLSQGLLTGKYRWGQPLPEDSRGQTSAQIITWLSQHGASVDRFIHFAEQRELSPVQLAISWVRYSPAVTSPIVGVSRIEQLDDALGALDVELSADEIAALEAPYAPHPVLGIQ